MNDKLKIDMVWIKEYLLLQKTLTNLQNAYSEKMKIRQHIKTLFTISIFSLSLISKGQIGTIKVKKLETTKVAVSIANMTFDARITIGQLLKDPIVRLENNIKGDYTLKKYMISPYINGVWYSRFINGDTVALSTELINIIRTSKKEFNNKLLVEDVWVIDKEGNEFKITGVVLKLLK